MGAGSRQMFDLRAPWRPPDWGLLGLERRTVSGVTTSQQEALAYVQQGSLRGFVHCEAGQTRCRRKPVRAHVISRVQLTHVTDRGHGIRIASRPSVRRRGESWNDYRQRVLQFDAVGMDRPVGVPGDLRAPRHRAVHERRQGVPTWKQPTCVHASISNGAVPGLHLLAGSRTNKPTQGGPWAAAN